MGQFSKLFVLFSFLAVLAMPGCKSKKKDVIDSGGGSSSAAPSGGDDSNPPIDDIDDGSGDGTGDLSLRPPYTFDLDLAANQIFGVRVTTDNKLKVRITPNLSCETIHPYTKLGFTMNVNGLDRVVQPIRTNVPSRIFNFSDQVGGEDGRTTIRVKHPTYDFYCNNYRWGCPSQRMYMSSRKTDWSRVRWCALVEISTNNTRDLPAQPKRAEDYDDWIEASNKAASSNRAPASMGIVKAKALKITTKNLEPIIEITNE